MTESEWLDCTDPTPMLRFLEGKATARKLRLYACACCRRIWHHFTDEECRNGVEIAERFADGNATDVELVEAHYAARRVPTFTCGLGFPGPYDHAVWSVQGATKVMNVENISDVASAAIVADHDWDTAEKEQVIILRDIFVTHFRPVAIEPAWLIPTVLALAQASYDNRNLPSGTLDNDRLVVLADALEDAGASGALLNHLRSEGPHVRGCFAVDLLLGKQ